MCWLPVPASFMFCLFSCASTIVCLCCQADEMLGGLSGAFQQSPCAALWSCRSREPRSSSSLGMYSKGGVAASWSRALPELHPQTMAWAEKSCSSTKRQVWSLALGGHWWAHSGSVQWEDSSVVVGGKLGMFFAHVCFSVGKTDHMNEEDQQIST